MNARLVVCSVFGAVLLGGCVDRKQGGFDAAIVAGEAGTSRDTSSASDTKTVMGSDTGASTDIGAAPGIDTTQGSGQEAGQDILPDTFATSDLGSPDSPSPSDTPLVGLDSASSTGPEVARDSAPDLGPDVLLAQDVPLPDAPADVPAATPDVGGTCPTGQKACVGGSGTTCIASSACCVNADCPGTCQSCNASHACVAAVSQDDPNGRCQGTCDSTGACKSKKGQTCSTTTGGCIANSFCAPDGYCCDQSCENPCQACDLTGFLGKCTAVASGNPHGNRASCTGTDTTCAGTCAGRADGMCSFPTSKPCGAAQSCSGTDKVLPQSMCSNGDCPTATALTCTGGFACAANSCSTTCQTSADCQAAYFCYNNKCHADVVNVGSGIDHTCAVLNDGRVFCWGGGGLGDDLGDGVRHTTPSGVPVQVVGITNAKSTVAANYASCALMTSGTVMCWGDGTDGQLATGVVPPTSGYTSNSPVAVKTSAGTAPAGVTALYSGSDTFCALTATTTYCWGNDTSGLLGFTPPPATNSQGISPIISATPLTGLTNPSSFGMGYQFQIAVFHSTTVNPWGLNYEGNVVSNTTIAYYPNFSGQPIYTNNSVIQVSVGIRSACLLLAGGGVQCWGGNLFGQLGDGTTGVDPIPGKQIPNLTATHLASGQEFVCAQTAADTRNILCWGLNANGIINPDINNNLNFTTPTTVPLGLPQGLTVTDISASSSSNHICAIISDGSVMCWGSNSSLQTGTGVTSSDQTVPTFVQANW